MARARNTLSRTFLPALRPPTCDGFFGFNYGFLVVGCLGVYRGELRVDGVPRMHGPSSKDRSEVWNAQDGSVAIPLFCHVT